MQPTEMINHPQLSEGTIRRMRSTGLDPDEMSEEQLEAIESLDNPAKSHWLVKPFIYIGGFLQILALFALITADWGALIDYGVTGSILLYIGYRIQRRIAAKKLLQASINSLQPPFGIDNNGGNNASYLLRRSND